MISLTVANRGKRYQVKALQYELIPAVTLTVLGHRGRPIMIGVNDTKLSPSFGMAKKIMGG